jgi:subtilisin-like proprotein convertase family protein
MKQIFTLLNILLFSFFVNAQFDRKGDLSDHVCGFDHIHQHEMNTNPEYRRRTEEFNEMMLNFALPKSGADYQVPVVVHVLHRGEAVGTGTNISDEAVKNGIKWLNEYWRKIPGTNGFGDGVDMTIEFALAVRDPSGNCTNGIVRRNMSGNAAYMSCGVNFPGSGGCGMEDIDAKSGRWPTNRYYNIYVVEKIDNANCFTGGSYTSGYAYFASSHGFNNDGTVILTCSYVSPTSTTLAHELGHAFNLYHTFEANTPSCTVETNCATQGDRCCDTQPHRQTDCGATGCTGSGTLTNSTRNYMSYCGNKNLFTADQRTRSLAALTSQRGSFLPSNGNVSLIPPAPATVDFSASASAVCVGSSVRFTDMSFCIPNTYTTTGYPAHTFSWTFSGPVTLTSSEQNPSITFNTVGTYDVTLSITNDQGTFSETKFSYIEVTSTPVAACIPTSTNVGNFAFTVNNVNFNTINNSTSTLTNVAYTDFSCSHSTIVEPGETYPISITIRSNNYIQYFEVYIDYNNDGIFQIGEKVFEGNSGTYPTTITRTGNITIPTTAVENTLLRMRVMGEADNPPSAAKRACTTQYFVGDVEDYGVFIKPACTPPTQPLAISGETSVCENSTHVYSIASVADATSYTWSVPADATINSGQGSTNISVTFGASGGNISVTANNACGPGAARTQTITIATPSITSVTPGSRCGTGTVLLEATASAGTISWFALASGGSSLGSGNTFTTPSISATTIFYAEATNSGCTTPDRTPVEAQVINVPLQTSLISPADGAIDVNVSPTYSWSAVADAVSYEIQIATDLAFTSIVTSTSSVTNSYNQSPALSPNTTFYWRVRAVNSCGNSIYSDIFSFTTENFICNDYASTNVPIIIPSASAATVTSTLNITDNIIIDKLNVSNLVGTHTWINDLIVSLTSPSGTTVVLFSRICGSQDNFNVKFDDDAPSATLPCPPVDGNYYRPNQPLSAFIGESSLGTWTLTIQDVFAEDGGSLNAWSLFICGTACSSPAPTGLACYETATFNDVTCAWDVTGTQPAAPTVACYETATFNDVTCVWDVTGTQPTAPTGLACYETATFNDAICDWEVSGSQPAAPTVACYETATFNDVTCVWDVTGTQPAAPTVACYETATFNDAICDWEVSGSQPVAPTVACYETATFNNAICDWEVSGTQPAAPTVACYETATFNDVTCAWDVTGSQPAAPTGLACYETATFNDAICDWEVSGSQPAAPTVACYETATFNDVTCAWDVTGSQPAAPTGLACYETATFNDAICDWEVSGSQPVAPTGLACYETATFNDAICDWEVSGSQPAAPTGLACYETATFNDAICDWEVSGSQPAAPTVACYETATFNDVTCAWDVTGSQPAAPTGLACYETATFNDAICDWEVSGSQPVAPTGLACYETATFNDVTCAWDVTGSQPAAPTGLACYETATFNDAICDWEVSGSQPAAPTVACYETATFNDVTCAWDVTGSQPAAPTGLACYETATFNDAICDWEVSGSQPVAPTVACYETATFNDVTCAWDVTGTQPAAPTGLACYETATFNDAICDWEVSGSQPAAPTVACYETATFNDITCAWDVTGSQPAAPTGLACYETATFNDAICDWEVSGSQPVAPTGLACYETATFNDAICDWEVSGSQPAAPTVACYETATFNDVTCAWDVTGSQPAAPTGLACYETATFNDAICDWEVSGSQPAAPTVACYETATFNDVTCAWDVTGSQPAAPTGLACYETATFNDAICDWEVSGSQPVAPTGLACYETATFNDVTCAWDVTGSQPAAPTGLACYETATFNDAICDWEVSGSQPAAPTVACYETATFNDVTCAWDVTGSQPAAPTGLACYETATFNDAICDWEVSGSQPVAPTVACYETATFNDAICDWEVSGSQPAAPTGLACYETATFNDAICDWEVSGSQPAAPTVACYETATFNDVTCAWDVTGTQPAAPTVACYETASFNDVTCVWDVTGTQPTAPTGLACYETATFNDAICDWEVSGSQPAAPTVACYETATFNDVTCAWDVTGTQPTAPTGLACYETATFNDGICDWEVSGSQPAAPTVACYETASFNDVTCAWDVTGTQPAAPTGLACYETATFNDAICDWEVSGTQPAAPTGLACYETATFNDGICDWEVSGSQPAAPTGLACYETATFNDVTCAWDVTGSQPAAPTGLACYETATFNDAICDWEVSGSQPAAPTVACYETATFNDVTCVWDVTGTQPTAPTGLACYETATFNDAICDWEVSGSQPAAPTVACYETATFNDVTCAWDVTGSQPAQPPLVNCWDNFIFNNISCSWDNTGTQPLDGIDTRIACDNYTWIDGITYTGSTNTPSFTIVGGAANGCDSVVILNLTIIHSSSVTLNEQICDGDVITIGGQSFTSSGSYQIILTNAAGCDSIVSLSLIVNTPDNTSETLSSCNPADEGVFVTNHINQFGCDSTHTRTVTLIPATPMPGTISGNTLVCAGSTHTYTINPVIGANGYLWAIPADAQIISGQGSTTLTVQFGLSGGHIGVSSINGCGPSDMQILEVENLPTNPPSVSIFEDNNNLSICAGEVATFIAYPQNAGVNPSVEWFINGISTGILSDTFSTTGLNNADIVSCIVISSNPCASTATAASNSLIMTVTDLDETVIIFDNTLTANEINADFQWFDCDNNVFIQGATSQSFTPSSSGNYAVVISKNNCQVISDCYEITGVSIAEVSLAGIRLYPNPNNGQFYLEITEVLDYLNVEIMDAIGKLVYKNDFYYEQKIMIDIEHASGVYFLRMKNKQGDQSMIKFSIY